MNWMEYVNAEYNICGLCGNTGVIDTRESAVTSAGLKVGGLHACSCPNGRALKKAGINLEQHLLQITKFQRIGRRMQLIEMIQKLEEIASEECTCESKSIDPCLGVCKSCAAGGRLNDLYEITAYNLEELGTSNLV